MRAGLLLVNSLRLLTGGLLVRLIPLLMTGRAPHIATVASLVFFYGSAADFLVFAAWNLAAGSRPRVRASERGIEVSWSRREHPVPGRRDTERARALIAAYPPPSPWGRHPGGTHIQLPSRKIIYLPPGYRYVAYGEPWPAGARERYIVHEVRSLSGLGYRAEIREMDTNTGEVRVLDRYQLPVLVYHECRDPDGTRLIDGVRVAPLRLKAMKLMPGQEAPLCLDCGSDHWVADEQ